MQRILSELRLYMCNHLISRLPSHRLRLAFYRRVMGFAIAEGSYVFLGCSFDSSRGLGIGKNSVINANCRIDTRGLVSIGQNVSISNEVVILTADHDMETAELRGRNRPVHIGDYVWIGTRAMIMPGVQIGEGAIVAAGSVVTRSVPAGAVVAGIPARVVRQRPHQGQFTYSASFKRLFQ